MSALIKQIKRRAFAQAKLNLDVVSIEAKAHLKATAYEKGAVPNINTIVKGFYSLLAGSDTFKTGKEWRVLGYKIKEKAAPYALWGKPIKRNGKLEWRHKYVYTDQQVKKINSST
jgi:hypothetical protein